MVVVQHDDDSLCDEALETLCNEQANQGGYFLFNTRGRTREQDSNWETSPGFWSNLPGLIQSFAEPQEEIQRHCESARQVAEAAVEPVIARFQRAGSARRWDGTCFKSWPTHLAGSLAKADRKNAERINQELQEKLCQMFQSEAAIDYACDRDRVLREHFIQVAKNHREEIVSLGLQEIFEPRRLGPDETEDDETETARALSEREERELLRQHRNLGHPQPTELARALRHAGARREAIRFVLKEFRCPTWKFDHCHFHHVQACCHAVCDFNQCIGVDLVDLEVRDGTSAKALNMV